MVVFDDGELVGDDEFVVVWVVEVDGFDEGAAFVAVFLSADVDAFGEEAVEGFVVG